MLYWVGFRRSIFICFNTHNGNTEYLKTHSFKTYICPFQYRTRFHFPYIYIWKGITPLQVRLMLRTYFEQENENQFVCDNENWLLIISRRFMVTLFVLKCNTETVSEHGMHFPLKTNQLLFIYIHMFVLF